MTTTAATATTSQVLDRRYDFLLYFDVKDGNPNGDPDAGNLPRTDPESLHGLVTDVALKRKVRNYVELFKATPDGNDPGFAIYVRQAHALEEWQQQAYNAIGVPEGNKDKGKIELARQYMCKNFYDVRTFGAVMSTTEFKCGQVRGPVQLTFARSMDPVVPIEAGITRVAFTTFEKKDTTQGSTEMGRKNYVPYALYAAHGFVSPAFARQTGFTYADLDLLFAALLDMFDHDRSAARGLMATRRLYVFQHASALGNARAHDLFESVQAGVKRKDSVEVPRAFNDYQTPDAGSLRVKLPNGITLRELVSEGRTDTPWAE